MPYNMFIWNMVNLGKVEIWGVDANINTTFQLAKHYSLLFDRETIPINMQ